MTFDELKRLISPNNAGSARDRPKVRIDSRLVEQGDVFVAIAGTVCNGHDFIDQAVANGAEYVVCQPGHAARQCETIVVDDPATAAGVLAQAAAGNPAVRLTNLAVTGTNGKTTVAFLVRSVIQQARPLGAGPKCGLIGTVTYDTCLPPGGSGGEQEATMRNGQKRCRTHGH